MSEDKKKLLEEAYCQLCEELGAALYEEDPLAMGINAGAPRNEYDDEAARIAANLQRFSCRGDVASHLREVFGDCSQTLIDRIDRSLVKFRLRKETAIRIEGR